MVWTSRLLTHWTVGLFLDLFLRVLCRQMFFFGFIFGLKLFCLARFKAWRSCKLFCGVKTPSLQIHQELRKYLSVIHYANKFVNDTYSKIVHKAIQNVSRWLRRNPEQKSRARRFEVSSKWEIRNSWDLILIRGLITRRTTFRHDLLFIPKEKYLLFTGREVLMGKNCARGLEYGPSA